MIRGFFDTNVLIYSVTAGDPRRPIARALLEQGGAIGTQCLNEFATVARRKLALDWSAVGAQLRIIEQLCSPVVPLDIDVHRLGLGIAERHRLAVYDGMIVAAALTAGCDTLYSEHMHHGLVIDGRLTIMNPFVR